MKAKVLKIGAKAKNYDLKMEVRPIQSDINRGNSLLLWVPLAYQDMIRYMYTHA